MSYESLGMSIKNIHTISTDGDIFFCLLGTVAGSLLSVSLSLSHPGWGLFFFIFSFFLSHPLTVDSRLA